MPVFPTKTHSKPAVYLPSRKKSVKQRKQYMSTCRLLTGSSKLPLILGYYYPCLSWVLKQRVQVWLFSVGYWWRGGSWHGSCRPSWVISSWRPRGLWGGCSCTPGCTHAVKKKNTESVNGSFLTRYSKGMLNSEKKIHNIGESEPV